MISVTCRTCGKRYDYSKDGCCPECGAYNRPPRHELVNADGTVRHLTDAEFAGRKSAVLDKVCFEDKECYEDEARPASRRAARPAAVRKTASPRAVFTVLLTIFVIIFIGAVIAGILEDFGASETEPAAAAETWEEPSGASGGDYGAWQEAPHFTAADGTFFRLLDWRREDDAIVVLLDVEWSEDESGHTYYGTLECYDADGNRVVLDDLEAGPEEYDGEVCLALYFFTDDESLTPAAVILDEWDETAEEYVSTWYAALGAES